MLSGDFGIGLMAIITGLAIADMVASTHGLLMDRRRVRWDWLAALAATFIFLLTRCPMRWLKGAMVRR